MSDQEHSSTNSVSQDNVILPKDPRAQVILSNSLSTKSKPMDSPTVEEYGYRTAPDSQVPGLQSCRSQIQEVVGTIESPDIRKIVETVCDSLLRLLECLTFIERHLRQVATAEETLALFQLIRDEGEVLVEFIREKGLKSPAMNDELIEILDGITFAISHDLRRVFEPEQRAEPSERSGHSVVGHMYRAHDLLTNCLQQSTVTLARVFAPEMVEGRLFNNSDLRFRQSLQLCDDLTTLLQLIEGCEEHRDQRALLSLSSAVERFRNQRLECLMYSDWPQFESFCETIKVAGNLQTELGPVLHQFRCYLETLLGQVKMRAVLADVFPSQAARFGSQDDSAPWDPFAVAV